MLDALPVTAVGKPFKPALRADATRSAVADALARRRPRSPASEDVVEDGAVVAIVSLAPAADETAVKASTRPLRHHLETGDCHERHIDSRRRSSSSPSRRSARPSSPPCPPMRARAEHVGFSVAAYRRIGLLEILAVVGLLVGASSR